MDMTLAYRILSLERVPPDLSLFRDPAPSLADALRQRIAYEAEAVATVPKLSLSNVARFLAEHDRDVWDAGKDIPNWAPPFDQFFVEWDEPEEWVIGGKRTRFPSGAQNGFL